MSYVSVEENQQLPVEPTLLQLALFILTAAVLTASKHNFLNLQRHNFNRIDHSGNYTYDLLRH